MPFSAGGGQRLFVEFRDAEGAPLECPVGFRDDPTVLLGFISWAFSVRYGAVHELAEAAKRLEVVHKLRLRPLLRYADRDAEYEADRRELERVWQPAADLAECCRAVLAAFASADAKLAEQIVDYPELPPRLEDLAAMCEWARDEARGGPATGAEVRLSFELDRPASSAPRPAMADHGPLLGPLGRGDDPRAVH